MGAYIIGAGDHYPPVFLRGHSHIGQNNMPQEQKDSAQNLAIALGLRGGRTYASGNDFANAHI